MPSENQPEALRVLQILGQQDQAQRILQEMPRAPEKIDLSKGWPGLFGWWDNHLPRQLFEREADQLILQHGGTAQRGEEAQSQEESPQAVKALDAKAAK